MTVEGRRIAYVGDGNNVTASLAFAAALSGVELVVATPEGYELDPHVVDRARNLGGTVEVGNDAYDAVHGADVVYTDVWTSMGQETEREQRLRAFAGLDHRRRADESRERPTRSSCTACPRTGARRLRRRSSTVRSRSCGNRPATACTPSGPCWSSS